jgi:hypothetical protein
MSRITFIEEAGSPLMSAHSGDFGDTSNDAEDALQEEASGMLLSESSMASIPAYMGTGYELEAKYYQNPTGMERPYYFTSKLGAPFPSYHSNPEAFFPPRWTSVRDAKLPVENITAPRIRLGPRELESRHLLYKAMTREAAKLTDVRPKPKVMNLCHQVLGDPYQFEALKLQLTLNATVEVLNLNDNELDDITSLPLQAVKKLYLDNNSICSFLQIPDLPNCTELILTSNFITGYSGLEEKRFPKLRKICVHGNPVCTKLNHRNEIVRRLPNLMFVDWFSRHVIIKGQNVSASDVYRGAGDDECC